jgi:hypothetical protein
MSSNVAERKPSSNFGAVQTLKGITRTLSMDGPPARRLNLWNLHVRSPVLNITLEFIVCCGQEREASSSNLANTPGPSTDKGDSKKKNRLRKFSKAMKRSISGKLLSQVEKSKQSLQRPASSPTGLDSKLAEPERCRSPSPVS